MRVVSPDELESRLRDYQSRAQAVLDRVLPAADVSPQRLHAAQRYAVLGGGKRLRPLLVYCTGGALGIPASALDAPAAAVHRLKTGALIRASVLLAAACAPGLTAAEWDALDAYSQDIGLAFQIQDDILDVEGNTQDLGKTIGADAARAKPTYPSVLGLEAAKTRARELQSRACDRLALFSGRAQILAWLASYVLVRPVFAHTGRRLPPSGCRSTRPAS